MHHVPLSLEEREGYNIAKTLFDPNVDLQLARVYKSVIATDVSQNHLEFAAKLPNVRYQQTPPLMSIAELESSVATESSVDVVTIAQAMHWFDLPKFYQQVKWVLKKPHGAGDCCLVLHPA